MRTLIIALALFFLVAPSIIAQDDEHERVVKEAFKTSDTPEVIVETRFGGVNVTAVKGNTVKAVVRISVFADSKREAQRIAEDVRVDISGNSSKVRIRTALPDSDGDDEDRNIDIEVIVSLPVKSKLEVESKFGEVNITGVQGSVEADCSFGSVEIKNCANVKAQNSFGDLSLGKITGHMHIEAQMGRIRGYGVPGGTVESAYGDVEITGINGTLNVESSMGSVTLKGLRSGEIENSYGSIDITVHKSFAGRISAKSSFGSIDSDFELKSTKKKRSPGDTGESVAGNVGKGKDKIVVKSSFGDVDIRKP